MYAKRIQTYQIRIRNEPEEQVCRWKWNIEYKTYKTACGELYSIFNTDIFDNCPHCERKIAWKDANND